MATNEEINKKNEPMDSGLISSGNLKSSTHNITYLSGLYENWFLDYASYVILERAVPALEDGLKPVQRRILHSMKDLDDGRYNKVANLIGHTMKYHPHGDASIGDALVQLGQKELLIDTQGNWGNILTGDGAAAPRYIEARLSKFATEVVFNPKTTNWQLSYDGRNKEPITLPVKFPLLLAQGVEGIAVGLASKILPHNFIELIDASIEILKGNKAEILPDFLTGGMADFSNYNDGIRGGRIKIRAKISLLDNKTLVITEIPYGTTTLNLIESIVSANDKGKIKIKKIEDNTAENVEILVHLIPGTSPDKTIDALYAFTECEISISPNCCVIAENKPIFIGVSEILKISTNNTINLLKLELEIHKGELQEQLLFASLERLFIEKRIYRNIEECETWESVIETIDKGLKPFKKQFYREITTDDITRLTEIKIKRISKFDSNKADEIIKGIKAEIEETQNHLDNLVDYAINYFKQIKKKYSKGKERKTEIRNFETIQATKVVAINEKLYVNKIDGFAGTGLKKDEFVCDCSDIDDMIVFREDGTFIVTKVADKVYVGKGIMHIGIFKKDDHRTIYNMVYLDGPRGNAMIKRFNVTAITRDKEYDLTKGTKGSKTIYFTANPNGEAETITIFHKAVPRIKKLKFDFNFADIAIKGRNAQGNILTKVPIRKIAIKEQGSSTLGGRKIWYEESVNRLTHNEYGKYLGEFFSEDKILTITESGYYRLTSFDLTTHFDNDLILIKKFNPKDIISVIYWDNELQYHYVKRFNPENTDKKTPIISEDENSKIVTILTDKHPRVEVVYSKKNKTPRENETIALDEFIDVKGFKAKGKRLSNYIIQKINPLEPLIIEGEEETVEETKDIPVQQNGNSNKKVEEAGKEIVTYEDNSGNQMVLDLK